jgi:glucose/arabinose dehydrogenase
MTPSSYLLKACPEPTAMKARFLYFSIFLPLAHLLASDSYLLETLPFPADQPAEVGDLAFDENGLLYACLRRGDVVVSKPEQDLSKLQWKVFATGLHNGMGMEILAPGKIVVSQMAELTLVEDLDGDGVADRYRNLCSDFGISGNYHETNAICPDGEGGFYIALGTASHNGPTFDTSRGEYKHDGRRGRNFSAVKHKGYVLHLDKDGNLSPYANGFRMHNGIARDDEGKLWCGDNQGDWRGGSPIYCIEKGGFYGHPSSLVWDDAYQPFSMPLFYPRKMLDELYNKPAMELPRNLMHSPGEPMVIRSANFGPFAGQILVPDENARRIVRLMPETVDSATQGAAVLFYENNQLRAGGVRMAMNPDGKSLYYGSTTRGWQRPDEGIQRLTYSGKAPFHILGCSLTTDGFLVQFTQPIANAERLAEKIKVRSFRFQYGYKYGSGENDQLKHEILGTEAIGSTSTGPFHIKVENLLPGRIYELSFDITSESGETMKAPFVQYTLNRLARPKSQHPAKITSTNKGFEITIGGQPFATYNTTSMTKPILWPVIGPNGQSMLRDYPLKKDTPGEAHDHIHHHGIFIGHEGTNQANFWHIDKKNSGKVEQRRVIETRQGEDRALIKTLNAWKDKESKTLLADTRTLSFWGDETSRTLDLEIHFHACNGPVHVPAYKDGFLGIRTDPDLRLTPNPKEGVKKVFGQAVNSEGISGKKIWGKRADWVHYFGQIDGKPAGIAFLSHPTNPAKSDQKAWWHARDYGLIAANPFAPEKMGGDGPRTIAKGESLGFRYRIIFHSFGTHDEAKIEEMFAEYTNELAHPTSNMPPHPGYPEDYLVENK